MSHLHFDMRTRCSRSNIERSENSQKIERKDRRLLRPKSVNSSRADCTYNCMSVHIHDLLLVEINTMSFLALEK